MDRVVADRTRTQIFCCIRMSSKAVVGASRVATMSKKPFSQ